MSRTKPLACSGSTGPVRTDDFHLSHAIRIFKGMDADSRTSLLTYLRQLDALLVMRGSTPAWLREPTKKMPSGKRKTVGFSGSSRTKR